MGSCRPQSETPLKTHSQKIAAIPPLPALPTAKPSQTPESPAACHCQPVPASQWLKHLLIRLGRFLTAERQRLGDKQPLSANPVKERQSSPPWRVQHGSSPQDYPAILFFTTTHHPFVSAGTATLYPFSVPRSHFTLTSPVQDLTAEQKAFLHTLSQAI